MTEQVSPTGPEDAETEQSSGATGSGIDEGGVTTTGVPAVDGVLADVDRLDALPLEEHLAAFERAHDSLRAALDAPAADQPGQSA